MDLEKKILSDVTVHMKYARYIETESRRENWDELVTRNMEMHIKIYAWVSIALLTRKSCKVVLLLGSLVATGVPYHSIARWRRE